MYNLSANLLVRIHVIIVMIRWTGLAPREFEFLFAGSLTSTFLMPPATQLPVSTEPTNCLLLSALLLASLELSDMSLLHMSASSEHGKLG